MNNLGLKPKAENEWNKQLHQFTLRKTQLKSRIKLNIRANVPFFNKKNWYALGLYCTRTKTLNKFGSHLFRREAPLLVYLSFTHSVPHLFSQSLSQRWNHFLPPKTQNMDLYRYFSEMKTLFLAKLVNLWPLQFLQYISSPVLKNCCVKLQTLFILFFLTIFLPVFMILIMFV